MTDEQKAALVQSQAVAALIEAFAMNADNAQAAAKGMPLAYSESHFMALIDKYALGWNSVCSLLRE
jgi:hypothetical protein